jgi:uncharacterized delta-60 repeat protein
MHRILLAALAAVLLAPAAAQARDGEPDRGFGRRGTVTLKATAADAVGGAVKVLSDNRVLAGGSAAGQLVVLRLRSSGSLDSRFGTRGQVVPALPGSSQDGVRALATFRDGRIVAAGTLRLADGSTRMVALRLLPTGEIDPSFGAGLGYVLAGPASSELGAMVMDRNGNVILGGSSAGAPIVIRLLPDGSPDPGFGAGGAVHAAAFGVSGRVTGLLVRPTGTLTLTAASGLAAFTAVRLQVNGAPDATFGGTGVVTVPLGPGSGPGIGAAAVRSGPGDSTLIAGTDVGPNGAPRGAVIRLRPEGTLDTRFGNRGIARITRADRDIRITSMVRDNTGRILLAGTARPPFALVVRLRSTGARDMSFGNGGLTYPRLGRPPLGTPVYTSLDAIDAAGGRAVLAGSAAGPGPLTRGANGTVFGGRFALTVSRLR